MKPDSLDRLTAIEEKEVPEPVLIMTMTPLVSRRSEGLEELLCPRESVFASVDGRPLVYHQREEAQANDKAENSSRTKDFDFGELPLFLKRILGSPQLSPHMRLALAVMVITSFGIGAKYIVENSENFFLQQWLRPREIQIRQLNWLILIGLRKRQIEFGGN